MGIKDRIIIFVIKVLLRIRWIYFHLNPLYVKFSMEGTECHFWHRLTNTIHSDLRLVENTDELP